MTVRAFLRSVINKIMSEAMKIKLDKLEKDIEDNLSQFAPVSNSKKTLIERIIDNANEKKSILKIMEIFKAT
jgi:hypothetical protein